MSKVVELLDEAKKACGIEADNALAKLIGEDRRLIHELRTGHHYPRAYLIMRLAVLAKRDPLEVINEIEQERETRPERVAWLRRFAKEATTAALTILATVLLFSTAPEKAVAAQGLTSVENHPIHIIALLMRKFAAWLSQKAAPGRSSVLSALRSVGCWGWPTPA